MKITKITAVPTVPDPRSNPWNLPPWN
jgi:galactonate dehydratase